MGVSQVPGLEQNYQYGLYGQGSKIPFGGLTALYRKLQLRVYNVLCLLRQSLLVIKF